MFSATFEQRVQELTKGMLCKDYVSVWNDKKNAPNPRVQQHFLEVPHQLKKEKLYEILNSEVDEAKKIDRKLLESRSVLLYISRF